jgi:HTH-type transcriptional regulator/antitoxin HigA
MDIQPIRTEADYEAALAEIERLFDAAPHTPEGDRLEVLATLVEAYEEQHYSIPAPDPIEAIQYYMESRGLCRRDLEPYLVHLHRSFYAITAPVLYLDDETTTLYPTLD